MARLSTRLKWFLAQRCTPCGTHRFPAALSAGGRGMSYKALRPARQFSCLQCRRTSTCASLDVCLESACLATFMGDFLADRIRYATR